MNRKEEQKPQQDDCREFAVEPHRAPTFKLEDTYEKMCSSDYKERFLAEYLQTKIRYEKLKRFCNKVDVAEMTHKEEPKHDCPLHLLRAQQKAMGEYLGTLELRAEIEGVELPNPYINY